jgi:hypothetical protein
LALGITATRHSIFAHAPLGAWAPTTPAGLAAWFRYGVGLTTSNASLGNSNDFAHANWTKTECSITAGQADPDGGSNASRIADTSNTSAHSLRHTITSHQLGLTVFRIRAKANGRNWLWIGDNGTDRAFFNLSTGAVGTLGANVRSASTTDLGNGWWLCQFRVNQTSSNFDVGVANADNTTSYSGNGTSGAYVYQAEIDQQRVSQWDDSSGNGLHVSQATESLRPIWLPGTGISGLRALAQILSRATGGPSQLANHSMFALVKLDLNAAAFQGFIGIGGGTASSALGASATPAAWYGGHGIVTPTGTTLTLGTLYRLGKVVTGTSTQGYLNGAADGSPAISNAYGSEVQLNVGSYNSTGSNGASYTIVEAAFYSQALSGPNIASIDAYLQNVALSL